MSKCVQNKMISANPQIIIFLTTIRTKINKFSSYYSSSNTKKK